MKITRGFKIRGFILAIAFIAGFSFGPNSSAQEQHSYLIDLNSKAVTDIGTLGGTDNSIYASGINDAGQVVGDFWTAQGVYHAFITGPDGRGMRALGGGNYSSARGINDTGQVVGDSGGTVFITGPNGMGMRDIGVGDVHTGTVISFASGINDAGQVVGYTLFPGDETLAFITGPDGMGVRNLGNSRYVAATGINDAGQVVGLFWSRGMGDPTLGARHAFITGPDGMDMRDLGTLGGTYSYAEGINDAGQVVGYSYTAGGARHAFITDPDGTNMRDLGTLGGSFSFANGINDAGQVVGRSSVAGGGYHAFITGPDGAGMMDLNSLVDVRGGLILTDATGINNSGQVIAIGIVPEPEIYALFLAGLGLIGFMARRKKMSAGAFSQG